MAEQPSYFSSTLSQVFLGSMAFYGILLLMVAAGLIWANLDAEKAKLIIGWATATQTAITSAYLTARRTGNGAANEAPPRPPA